DTLYETGYLENGVKPFSLHESGFLLRTAFLRQAVFDLRMHYFLHYLIAAAATNGLILLGIWLIYRFYISPLQKLAKTFLSLPDSMLPTAPANDDEVAALVGRAKDIKNLLIDYHSSKEEARHYLETLKEAISMIHKLHEEQVTFLSTMSSEMEETFTAIHRYAGFVEGEIEEEYHHDDGLFLENLKDSAQNLKFLSNVFYLMCVHKSNEYSPEVRTLDLHHLLEQVVLLFSEVADYRHIAIDFPGQNAVCLIKSDETVLKHLLWGMLFIAMKFADDGARIRLETQEQDGMVLCRFHVSAILPEILPLIDEDLATFFPQSMTHGNLAKEAMENHINYKVLEYLLDHFSRQASLHISANENGHGFTLAATLFPMDA
ncbi:MAG: sensor histidine kinase, partial [Rickettsiales bacterium]